MKEEPEFDPGEKNVLFMAGCSKNSKTTPSNHSLLYEIAVLNLFFASARARGEGLWAVAHTKAITVITICVLNHTDHPQLKCSKWQQDLKRWVKCGLLTQCQPKNVGSATFSHVVLIDFQKFLTTQEWKLVSKPIQEWVVPTQCEGSLRYVIAGACP